MAFSLGSGRRRWAAPCRAAGTGIRRAAGCRHFHVHFHFHFPRQQQVRRAFSPPRLPPLFSLLITYMLVLPVLFFAVLAFLVCFCWFTSVYFVSACLLRKCNNSSRDDETLLENDRDAGASSERGRNEEESGGQELSDSSEKEQQLEETSADHRFVEEETGIGTASCGTANLVHLQSVYCQEFVASREEDPAAAYIQSDEVLELIDKHETRTVVVICSDNSADQNDVKYYGEDLLLPDDDDDDDLKVPEDFFDGSRLREDHHQFVEEKEKHILCVSSDETNDLNSTERETSGSLLILDSVSENKYVAMAASNNASLDHTSSDEEDGHEKQLITEDNMIDASGTASAVASDFSGHSQAIQEEIGVPAASTETNIHEVASGEISSVIGRTEDDEDETSCSSEGGSSRRLPSTRRSQPPPWWNLCGVLDVFTGCKD